MYYTQCSVNTKITQSLDRGMFHIWEKRGTVDHTAEHLDWNNKHKQILVNIAGLVPATADRVNWLYGEQSTWIALRSSSSATECIDSRVIKWTTRHTIPWFQSTRTSLWRQVIAAPAAESCSVTCLLLQSLAMTRLTHSHPLRGIRFSADQWSFLERQLSTCRS